MQPSSFERCYAAYCRFFLLYGLAALLLSPAPASVRLPRFSPEYETQADAKPEDASRLLWRSARLSPADTPTPNATPQQIRSNVRAILIADPLLGQAYSWRQMMRGNSQQRWSLIEDPKGQLRLELGAHSLPVMQLAGVRGSRAAAGLAGQRFGFYSMKPMRAINETLQVADELLGEAVSHDQTEINWVNLRPLQNSRGTLDLVYLHGQNDLAPKSKVKTDSQLRDGSMAGAKLAYALPARWKLEGEWMQGNIEKDDEWDDAIILALAGPVKHPWGETGVRLAYRDIGARFSTFAGTPSDAGLTTKNVTVQQPFKKGDISGAVAVHWSERSSNDESTSDLPEDTNLKVESSMRWQAASNMALTGSHSIGHAVTQRDLLLEELRSEQITERQSSSSRFGMEWRLSKQLSVTASGGITQYDEETAQGRLLRRLSNRDNHYSVALNNQTPDFRWSLKVERRVALDLEGDSGITSDTIALSAQKKLASWLQFGGTYRLSETENSLSGSSFPESDLTANTTFLMQELGSLELRYMQSLGSQPDGVRLGGGEPARGYGVRYVVGAASRGKGFGFSLDYARRETSGPAYEQWRLGLTYR